MHLAHDNDVAHTLTPDRPDQPFGKAILPRRGQARLGCPWRAICRDDAAIDPVAIADEVVQSLIPKNEHLLEWTSSTHTAEATIGR